MNTDDVRYLPVKVVRPTAVSCWFVQVPGSDRHLMLSGGEFEALIERPPLLVVGVDMSAGPDLTGVRCSCGDLHVFTPAELAKGREMECGCGVDLSDALGLVAEGKAP